MITDAGFYLAAVPAVTLMGLSKGGFAGIGMIGLPLMALAIPPVQAAAIILPILLVQDAFGVWVYRRNWDGLNLAVLMPGAAIGILVGYLLAAKVSNAAVALAVGIISVLFALRRLAAETREQALPASRPSRVAGVVCGALSGFTSMIAHAGTPPFQIYVLPQRLQRDVFIGTSVIFFAAVNWIKVAPYLALGQFTAENLTTSFALFPVAIGSTWLGVLLVRRVAGERFIAVMNTLLLLVGAKLIFDGLRALLSL
jgi:uncharacterized membrane protein YfcA